MNKYLIRFGVVLLILSSLGTLMFHYAFRNLGPVSFSSFSFDLLIISNAVIYLGTSIFVAYYFYVRRFYFPLITTSFLGLIVSLQLWAIYELLNGDFFLDYIFYTYLYFFILACSITNGIAIALIKGRRYQLLRIYGFAIIVVFSLLSVSYLLSTFGVLRREMVNLYGYLIYLSDFLNLILAAHFVKILRYKPEIDDHDTEILDR